MKKEEIELKVNMKEDRMIQELWYIYDKFGGNGSGVLRIAYRNFIFTI